jgi:protein-L-isoaspartate(D-aspartate) O-methyltransferase
VIAVDHVDPLPSDQLRGDPLDPDGVANFMMNELSPLLAEDRGRNWSTFERLMEWDVLVEETTIGSRRGEFASRVTRNALIKQREAALRWIGNRKESIWSLLMLSVELGLGTVGEALTAFETIEEGARKVNAFMEADPVFRAFAHSPRILFAPKEVHEESGGSLYEMDLLLDRALSIGRKQTNSQPSLVYRIAKFLDIQKGHRVLDGGMGTGQTASIFSILTGDEGEVVAVERQPDLYWHARAVVRHFLWRDNVKFVLGNVLEKIGELGSFDRIFIAATADTIPAELIQALRPGGRMIIPVRLPPAPGQQELETAMLKLITKGPNDEVEITDLTPCGFVPLITRG